MGSNPDGGMNVCILWVLCGVKERSLQQPSCSPTGVLSSVVCLRMIKESYRGRLGPLGLLSHIYIYIKLVGEVATATGAGASAGADISGADILNAT